MLFVDVAWMLPNPTSMNPTPTTMIPNQHMPSAVFPNPCTGNQSFIPAANVFSYIQCENMRGRMTDLRDRMDDQARLLYGMR